VPGTKLSGWGGKASISGGVNEKGAWHLVGVSERGSMRFASICVRRIWVRGTNLGPWGRCLRGAVRRLRSVPRANDPSRR
jgi:hypothetical protein